MNTVTYVLNGRFPTEKAHGHQVMQMCWQFAAQGSEVRLLVPDRKGASSDDPWAYYSKTPNFSWKRLWCIDGLSWHWLPKRFGFWLQKKSFFRSARNELIQNPVDIVYSRELEFLALLPSGLSRKIWEAHTIVEVEKDSAMLSRIDVVVVLTQTMRDRLLAYGYPSERIHVDPDAVEQDRMMLPPREEARRRLGIESDDWVIGYVGKFTTMSQSKGLEVLLDAVGRLREQGKRIRVLAVGGSAEELSQYSTIAGVQDLLVGHQNPNDLPSFYSAMDAVAMPFPWMEHYAYFMSPLKLFEYLSSGKPIITSDLPSVREIASENEVFWCAPGSAEHLASVITTVMENQELVKQKIEAALRLSALYTWHARVERVRHWLSSLQERTSDIVLMPTRGLCVFTQSVDHADDNLAFFVSWIREFARLEYRVYVLCWQYNPSTVLPANVTVYPMSQGKFARLWALWRAVFRLRKEVDRFFVHMIAIVAVATAPLTRLFRLRTVLWYTHGSVPWSLRLANRCVDSIATASALSMRLKTAKKLITGHGIDTDFFVPGGVHRESLLICVGRISPRKDQIAFVSLVKQIQQDRSDLEFQSVIIGSPRTEADQKYLKQLQKEIEDSGCRQLTWLPAQSMEVIRSYYQRAACMINPSHTGSLDKVVLEAMACETAVVASDPVYAEIPGIFFGKDLCADSTCLEVIRLIERPRAHSELRAYILAQAKLSILVKKLRFVFAGVRAGKDVADTF